MSTEMREDQVGPRRPRPQRVRSDRPELEVRTVDDGTEATFFEAESEGFDRMCRWLTVNGDLLLNLEDCR